MKRNHQKMKYVRSQLKSEAKGIFPSMKPFFLHISLFFSDNPCRRKSETGTAQNKNLNPPKRKKPTPKKSNASHAASNSTNITSDGHMTAEEVERHLQSRQSLIGLVPEAPATVPTEMFSNDPSLDR